MSLVSGREGGRIVTYRKYETVKGKMLIHGSQYGVN